MHALIAGLPGGMEWVILLIVALLLFGGSRLAGIGKGTGRAIREFKEETAGLRDGDKKAVEQGKADPVTKVDGPTEAEIQAERNNLGNL
ncbi:twin-arginine translocase TatA/TatE family subunit [Luteococcus sp. OSA5]|uniref:twin-arginine translocase TatA/TatE family subunit n=1 Tax=Luteococcus sp. OSA5 TaxID=3401630 RepID=UPI003B439DB9